MTDSVARDRVFAQAAECLRSLAQFRTGNVRALVSGPASESVSVKLLDLATKLDASEVAGSTETFSASERALLMEAFTSMAPLINHAQAFDVSRREMRELEGCAENFRSVIELIGQQAQ
jgi:hypothetical protein